MTIGQTVLKRAYVGAQPGQSVLVLPIFKSELEEPKVKENPSFRILFWLLTPFCSYPPQLVTSSSVEKCCELRFEINKEKAWREVQLLIKCYESELLIIATGNDGEVNHVAIDF
jgi:hypothetical protein